jgi:tripartite-type tricarboxylate transporter receptor subunit TctC
VPAPERAPEQRMTNMRHVFTAMLAGASCLTMTVAGQAADSFYKDKVVHVIVGHPPGGSYDFYARLAADMLKAALPEAKAVIVENKPGGGGLIATSWFYSQAPRDGTYLGLLPETIGNTQLMEPDVGKWDVKKLNYIGSFSPVNSVIMRRKDSPVKTPAEMKQTESIVGCTGTTAQSYQYPALLKVLGGFKFKMICGYPGANEYTIALQRGEIDLVSSAWNSWKVTNITQIESGDLVPVIQAGLTRLKDLPNVPLMQELVDDPQAKKAIEFTSAGAQIGRALLAPPGLPAERVKELRDLFDKMTKDPAMIDMAAKRRLDLDPTPGSVIQGYSDAIADTPADVVKLAVAAFKG